jgi:DNA-binding GntR family transcriptional regulator
MSQSLTADDSGRLRIRSVVDQVYDALLQRVLSGDIPPGTRLSQGALAEEMGVSRTPLREALRRLSVEGFVEFSTNQGATVSQFDLGDMRHAWTARLTLEPAAARLAAANADPADITRMRHAVQQQRLSAEDRAAGYAANREFHLALVAASRNPHLTRFSEMLWVSRIGAWIFSAQAADAPGETALWANEHDAIADAVEARDADLVERLTREHIEAYPPAEVR